MKKFILSTTFILVFSAYAVYARVFGASVTDLALPKNTAISKTTQASTSNSSQVKLAATTKSTNLKFKDGTFTGSSVDASYGNVQVRAQIAGDKIVNVEFLDYPGDRQNSIRINSRAMPKLISEAIALQDSNVDTVSGASYTSAAFRESLASVLAQAKI